MNGGLIGGIIAAIILLALLALLGLLLARCCGCCCFAAAAARRESDSAAAGVYETPLPIAVVGKKGVYEAGQANGCDGRAYCNNLYGQTSGIILGVPDEPPAYSIAGPIDDTVYGDVEVPPAYDNVNLNSKPIKMPAECDTETKGRKEKEAFAFHDDAMTGPSSDDIAKAKSGLKPTGAHLK